MRRGWKGVLAAALLLLAAGCTGTTEEPLPVLLVLGFEDAESPALALVEDSFGFDASADDRTLTYVPNSRRNTNAPVVALDVARRSGERDVVVALTRSEDGSEAYLERFEAEGIDPEAPAAFTPLDEVALHDLASDDLALQCPDALQVSRSGRYVVLLDRPAACGATEGAALFVVDLEAPDGARFVAAEDTEDPYPYMAVPPVLEQDRDPQRLYYLVEGPSPILRTRTLDEDADPGADPLQEASAAETLATLDDVADPVSLAPSGDTWVVAEDDAYVSVTFEEDAWQVSDPVETALGLEALVPLPFAFEGVVAYRTGGAVYAHRDAAQDVDTGDDGFNAPSVQDVTLGPNDFLFVLQETGILAIADLLSYVGNEDDTFGEWLVPGCCEVAEVEGATALTWIRGSAPPPTP